jgi:murein DD-endopeptidase MepM/ murein hydrolase activator NlpD
MSTMRLPEHNIVLFKLLATIGLLSFLFLCFLKKPIDSKMAFPVIDDRLTVDSTKSETIKPIDTKKIFRNVKSGETIISILNDLGFSNKDAYDFFTQVKPIYNLRDLKCGNQCTLVFQNQNLEKFKYWINANSFVVATKQEDGNYAASMEKIPWEVKREIVKGTIRYSLYGSIINLGERAELADSLASIYEYDIDFNRDLKEGDEFWVLVEKKYLKEQFKEYGDIIAAEFANQGKHIQIVRFIDQYGKTNYFHPDGRSIKKMFLRCPLPFMRVTSKYGMRRHPVLGFSAKHLGIDLAAPTGTIIRSTASGRILKMGFNKNKGNFLHIVHPNRYESHYYHLSRFAKGIRKGKTVSQGETIGYVGSTGLSTGPHLHYGLKRDLRFINPMALQLPVLQRLPASHMKDFKKFCHNVSVLLHGTHVLPLPQKVKDTLLNNTDGKIQFQKTLSLIE